MRNPFLVGSGIYLRPLEVADAPAMAPWFNDPEVNRTLLRVRPMTVLAEEEWVRTQAVNENAVILGVVRTDGDELIGSTGLHQIDHRNRQAAFGLVIGVPRFWGQGHGTEATRLILGHAFRTLNLN